MVLAAAREPEMVAKAKAAGATGINIGGLCCTGNELLMRQGIPMAGNHLMTELAIVTGAVDAMVVDYQCIMPSLVQVAACYHTKFHHHRRQGQVHRRHPYLLRPCPAPGAGTASGRTGDCGLWQS